MVIFLAGLPGTGKTSFGDWLEKNRGFFHLDMEDKFQEHRDLYQLWQSGTTSNNLAPFAGKILEMERNVVMTWGFPPHCIALAEGIKGQGISSWWFDGSRSAARAAWLKREGHNDDSYFNLQCSKIEAVQGKIHQLFAPNILRVLEENGTRMSSPEIAQMMSIRAD